MTNGGKALKMSKLNRLMDSAFANNMSLNNLYQQIVAAEAVRKTQTTFLLPDITGQAQTAVSQPETDFAGGESTQNWCFNKL